MIPLRAYLSPTLVLLAFDYPEAPSTPDFLGFTIRRKPGFSGAASSFLPNRIGFDGPDPTGATKGSDAWPIQKFYWWDAHITSQDRGTQFTYTVTPVHGSPDSIKPLEPGTDISVIIPKQVENKIGSYFNRAVVSSQAFSSEFGHNPAGQKLHQALIWLGNGMQDVVPQFLTLAKQRDCDVLGAIYHLSQSPQGDFIIPAMGAFPNALDIVYHGNDDVDQPAIKVLKPKQVTFAERTATHIMHDKFLVAHKSGNAVALVMGSANYTTEGLTQQANLMHFFDSAELAQLYYDRQQLIRPNPPLGETQQDNAGWSEPIVVGDATIRAFFAPEPVGERASLDAIVDAVNRAKTSVMFCLYDSTDQPLLDACFEAEKRGCMLKGLVNLVPQDPPHPNKRGQPPPPVQVEIYDHSIEPLTLQIVGHQSFGNGNTPQGFSFEDSSLGSAGKFPVYVHHKFVIIDGETIDPVIFSGSANLSKSSTNSNDENMLQITNCPRLSQIYIAEFLRLFEQYRARLAFELRRNSGSANGPSDQSTFELTPNNDWSKKWFVPGSSEATSRATMSRAV